ncbi:hypothetical protein Tco_0763773 [Tanacetum coccineum]
MKETKSYKTYLGFSSGAIPPKKARKLKKPASPQLSIVPVSSEEPTKKSKRVKRSAKKSTKAPVEGVVIRETPEMPLSKKKEKVDVARGKGIELLSEVALTEDAQYEEVRKKSLRDFHKTHPSGSGTVTKTTPSATKIKPSVTNEGTGVKPGVPDVTEEESSKKVEDEEEEKKDAFVKTPSNDSGDEDETKNTDNTEGDEDREIDYTTSQLYDDVDIRLNKPVQADDEMKTEVPVSSSSHSSDLAAKFLNFLDIPTTEADIVSPMDFPVYHEVPSDFASVFQFDNRVTVLEKEVVELKKDDPLKPQVTSLVDEHLDARIEATRDEFMNYLLASITTRITEQSGSSEGTKSQPKSSGKSVQSEEPEFEVADSDITQDQEGNLEPTNPDWNVGITPQQGKNQSWLMTLASSADKPLKTFDELMSTPIDFFAYIMNGLKITNLTQETLLGPVFRLLKGTRSNYAKLEYDFEECYKPLSEKLDWENPEGGDYQFDLTKSLPLVMSRNHQKVPVDYFFNNDLKYMQIGVSTMTYTTSITKTKATQYDLLGIEDMVEVMRKHRYGYLKEIVVRKVRGNDNDLYRFKEGDFPRLHINDIEDMLLFIVYNQRTNLSGDAISDFTIALRIFIRSLVIQKRVEDL